MDAYEDTIRHTATPHAPWVVVPANKKWFARRVVAAAVIDALDELNLAYPKVTPAKRVELQKGRRLLQAAHANPDTTVTRAGTAARRAIVTMMACAVLLVSCTNASADQAARRVLVLHWFGLDALFRPGFDAALERDLRRTCPSGSICIPRRSRPIASLRTPTRP